MLAYQNLSKYYHKLILDSDYEKWTLYLLSLLKEKIPCGSGYDVGCGTGIFTLKLKKAGYDVIGVDVSEQMLAVAKEITSKERLNVSYLNLDMTELKSLKKLDFITVVNDGINYVSQCRLKKTFKAFNRCLKKGGILLFDVSSKYKLKNVLSNNMYGDDGEDLSYIWLSEYDDDLDKLNINLSFFEKQGDVYKRFDEQQTQYAHEQQDLTSALISEGFEVLSVTSALGEKIKSDEQRLLFVAVKK